MRRFKALDVPPALMAVIAKAPVLAHESKDAYFALLARHFQDYGASRVGEFMTLIRATNCYWEITRLEEGRARLIDHWEPIARTALVKDHTPEIYKNFEQVLEKMYPSGIDPALLSARATIVADKNQHLAYFDKQIAIRQREYERILHSLAFQKAAFAT
jgi:hypothetical protein